MVKKGKIGNKKKTRGYAAPADQFLANLNFEKKRRREKPILEA